MFDETAVTFYDENKTKITDSNADVRNFDKQILIGDITIEVTKRLFCLNNSSINKKHYVKIDNQTYKIIRIRSHIGYMELWLYECEVIAIEN